MAFLGIGNRCKFIMEYYNLDAKHYTVLGILGVVEVVLFTLIFYNCYLELKQRRREHQEEKYKSPTNSSSGERKEKPSVMEIFSVDMTLKRDENEAFKANG
ncbi:hypothetical protein Ocin01_07525 [Orchesella cincta]|uniref:Uncharacterized protein n=1 Tax=Orchesella cincta TaxID=48709 RepID=A0A1D2N1H1_ORCCI|nr:hypothetical protein Ocin01_07525 [Orchesella cincta]